jgi:hypothetical protein
MQAAFDSSEPQDDAGVEAAFDLSVELEENVKTGTWVGACFIFTNAGMNSHVHHVLIANSLSTTTPHPPSPISSPAPSLLFLAANPWLGLLAGNRLNYSIGQETVTIAHMDRYANPPITSE